ncbi:MAG TPA: hydroxylamine reductase, partial [Lachnospiraceae bacterium]|nr:hydroxylamine reductase [Lachnospiraceae bacterium]
MTGSSSNNVTALHNLLLYVTKGICAVTMELRFEKKSIPLSVNYLINDNLVMANPRVNMDADRICEQIAKTLEAKENLLKSVDQGRLEKLPEASVWNGSADEYEEKALVSGNDMTEDEDIRCLRQMIIYAVQGVAAYVRNAAILGKEDKDIDYFIQNSMKKVLDDHLNGGELIASILEAGRFGIRAMNLLGAAKKSIFGAPEITEVSTGVRSNPGILVAGDNFRDLEQLLKQAEAQGVDVYSYSDMLSAHAYPKLKT